VGATGFHAKQQFRPTSPPGIRFDLGSANAKRRPEPPRREGRRLLPQPHGFEGHRTAQPVLSPVEVMPVLGVSAVKTLFAPLNELDPIATSCESTRRTPFLRPQPVVGGSATVFELTSAVRTPLNSKPLRLPSSRLPRNT
jgi:hypothetical protein